MRWTLLAERWDGSPWLWQGLIRSFFSAFTTDIIFVVKIDLLYVSTQLLWWQVVAGTLMVEAGQLVAQSLAGYWAPDRGDAERAQHLQQQHAHPVAPLR
jgi:hypothetical protein